MTSIKVWVQIDAHKPHQVVFIESDDAGEAVNMVADALRGIASLLDLEERSDIHS